MLGSDLMSAARARHEVSGADLPQADITDRAQCLELAHGLHPDVVINAAALTQVDYCESHEEEALRVNGHGAGNLAEAAASVGALLVHYSTDYVFDGLKEGPYLEEDTPNPATVYGRSKLLGEELVIRSGREHLILRTAWLFGNNGANFIRTIVEAARQGRPLSVVDDQRGSPTYSRDLAAYTLKMIDAGCRGTYHLTNSGSCSWYELAACALQWAGLAEAELKPATTAEIRRPAPRPANSVLANARLEREGFSPMRLWKDAAREYAMLL